MSEIKVSGLSDLQRFLDQLPAKISANILRGALRSGAKVIANAAKSNVTSVSGELAKSIRVSTRTKKLDGKVSASVKTGSKAAFYAHMTEFGTRPHVIKAKDKKVLKIGDRLAGKEVKHPGANPKPFMRPALDAQSGAAIVAAGEYIKKRLATKHGLDTADIEIGIEE